MKKIITWSCLIVFTLCLLLPVFSYASTDNQVYVNVNGQRIYPSTPAFIRNGRTLVPLRGIFEKLGASVEWNANDRSVTVVYKNTTVYLQIDNNSATVNGAGKWMDVAPEIDNNSTMIPLRFISESIGMWVQWIPETRAATVTDPNYFNNQTSGTVLGYTTNDYPGDNGSYSSLSKYHQNMTSIAAFSDYFDTSGNLENIGQSQDNSVALANTDNIKPLLLVCNYSSGNFDIDLAHAVLSNASRRAALEQNILVALSRGAYSGVNIDIEHIYWYDRQYYTSLVKELKQKLTPYGYLTTLSVSAKNMESNDNWDGAFDYAQIGQYADQITLMTYDEHNPASDAGPVASQPWVDSVLSYASSLMPAKKILLGIPGYGYDWSSSGVKALSYSNIENLIQNNGLQAIWDSSSMTPHLSYSSNGVSHNVWFENGQSLSLKLALVNKYGLGGIAIWKLGYDNDDFWSAIKAVMG
ncbi:MAG: stalk domain-containing protein [Bacillota bacterium]|nr:stalk domain-containing protein [Bacillota bacterium]